jgi:glycosyltransferase involved in cell wall biosynthesis
MVGDGKHRPELEEMTRFLSIENSVRFLGQLQAGEPVRSQLDNADLFVLPSLTEGLPRAMIEAMARGLPCIGSTVGGIPELLPDEAMVPPNDVLALADKIETMLASPEWMHRMAARNLKKAQEYRAEILQARRNAMYYHLKQQTNLWLERNV